MADAIEPDKVDPWGALRNPVVQRFMAGRLISVLGRQMLSVTVGWAIYERTHSAMALGIVGLVQVVPVVVLALPAGALSDRKSRRDMCIIAQLGMLLVALGLIVATRMNAPLSAFYALLFAQGVAVAFSAPATSALLPQLVPKSELLNATAWMTSGFQLSAALGPAAAGAVIYIGSAQLCYALAAGGAVVFIVMLFTLTPVYPIAPATREPWSRGLRFVFGHPILLPAITLDLFAVLLGGATALMPIFAKEVLHASAAAFGLLRSAPSLGAAAMSFLTTRLRPWRRTGRALLCSVVVFGVATIAFGFSRSLPLSLVMLFIVGASDNISAVIRSTLVQVATPDDLRGRVSAIHYVFIGMSNELGEFESGLTAAWLGPVVSVVAGGIGTLIVVGATAALAPAVRTLGRFDQLAPESVVPTTMADGSVVSAVRPS